jgi:hypothetical protein
MLRSLQNAKIPFLPLLEKLADSPFLYGVLSLLKRTYARDIRSTGSRKETYEGTDISIYAMGDVFGGQRGDLRVDICEHVGECLNEVLEFLFYATVNWFCYQISSELQPNA